MTGGKGPFREESREAMHIEVGSKGIDFVRA